MSIYEGLNPIPHKTLNPKVKLRLGHMFIYITIARMGRVYSPPEYLSNTPNPTHVAIVRHIGTLYLIGFVHRRTAQDLPANSIVSHVKQTLVHTCLLGGTW